MQFAAAVEARQESPRDVVFTSFMSHVDDRAGTSLRSFKTSSDAAHSSELITTVSMVSWQVRDEIQGQMEHFSATFEDRP